VFNPTGTRRCGDTIRADPNVNIPKRICKCPSYQPNL